MIGQFLGWIGDFLGGLFAAGLDWITQLFGFLFNGLLQVLKFLFRPVLIVIAILFYFIYKLGELVVLLFAVLVGIGKLLYAFIQGLIATFAGFVWTPSSEPDHGSWSYAFGQIFEAMGDYQLDKVAYVALFAIWILTAFAAIRLLSGGGKGGDD